MKILLIKNIFNSNRNFPHKDILALSAGGKKKSISFKNHTTCLQLSALILPKLLCVSYPQPASINFFHYTLEYGIDIMLIKFASTKLQGTAFTMEYRVRIQTDLNRLQRRSGEGTG